MWKVRGNLMNTAIFHLLIFFAEAFILRQYAAFTLKCRYSLKYNLSVLSGLYFVLFFISLFECPLLHKVAFFVCNYIYLYTMYQTKWSLAFFHGFIVMTTMEISELLTYCTVTLFSPGFFVNSSYDLGFMVFAALSRILYIFALYLFAYLTGKRKFALKHETTVFPVGLIPITSIIVILTFVKLCEGTSISSFADYMIILISFLLLMVNLLIYIVHQLYLKQTLEFTQIQLSLQRETDTAQYYKTLLQQSENQRILIHDIKNHLHSIAILNDKGEQTKVASYINQLQLSSDLKESAHLCDNQILNAILIRYQKKCTDGRVTFHTDIRKKSVDFISDNDITSLFCNLLDNAWESAICIPNSFIELNVARREHTPFVVVTVVNSCREDPFLGNSNLLTHKKNKTKHGFGMKSIKRTIYQYGGDMQLYYDNDSLTFHTIITLKLPASLN